MERAAAAGDDGAGRPRRRARTSATRWTSGRATTPAARALLEFLAARQPSNPVVLTGDIHSNWVNDLKVDFRDANAPVVATEFVGTSISSGGDGVDLPRAA